MNISFVLPNVPVIPAGGVIVVFQYAERLIKDGHDVTLYFQTDMIWRNKKLKYPNYVRRFIGHIGTYISPRWYKLDSKVKKKSLFSIADFKKHDIIVATGIETVDIVSRYSLEPIKKYYLIQDYENWGATDDYVLNSYNVGFHNIVISKWLFELVKKHSSTDPIYIPDGIDTQIFNCNCEEKRINHSIVFHYRSAEEKGCKYAIEVVKKLRLKYSDLKVVIVSKEEKNECIPEWCEYKQNIKLHEVAHINRESEIFLCTSINEGFGLPGLEAMACGCALCTTNYLGGREYAVDRKNALVSPVRDVEGMYRNVIELFENEELRQKVVSNGIRTAKGFSLERSYKKLLSAFLDA